jgi:hypothetical protein
VNGRVGLAEIVLIEHEIFSKVGALTEHEPSNSRIYKPVLMPRDVDRADLLKPEIPSRPGTRMA